MLHRVKCFRHSCTCTSNSYIQSRYFVIYLHIKIFSRIKSIYV